MKVEGTNIEANVESGPILPMHPGDVRRILLFFLPCSVVSLGFLVGELRSLQFPFGVLDTVEVLRCEVGLQLFLLLVILWTRGLAAGPLARALHNTLWSAFVVYALCAGFAFFTFAMLAAIDLDYYLMTYFFAYKEILARIPILGVRPDIIMLAPVVVPLLFPFLLLRYRKKGVRPAERGKPWPTGIAAALLLAAAWIPPQVRHDGPARPFLLRLLTPPAAHLSDTAGSSAAARELFGESAADPPVEAQRRFRHVAFIVLESTGALATSVYNPRLATTPFLARLAEDSIVVDRAYVTVAHTSKAFVSMMCGIWPYPHMEVVEQHAGAIPVACLPEVLGASGVSTVYFSSAESAFEGIGDLVEGFGFEESYPVEELDKAGFEKVNYFGYEDDIMLPASEKWLQEHLDQPTFAVYFTNTPHHDFVVPKRHERVKFSDDPVHDNYLNTVLYEDRFVEKVFRQYESLGLHGETLYVVIGDHGEAFGEHFRKNHDGVPYEETVRIPFLIHHRGVEPGHVPWQVSQLDVLPTVLELLGYSLSGDRGAEAGLPLFQIGEHRPLRTLCWYDYRCMTRILPELKRIDHFDRHAPEQYDLSEDPLETVRLPFEASDLEALEEMEIWFRRLDAGWKSHLATAGIKPRR